MVDVRLQNQRWLVCTWVPSFKASSIRGDELEETTGKGLLNDCVYSYTRNTGDLRFDS